MEDKRSSFLSWQYYCAMRCCLGLALRWQSQLTCSGEANSLNTQISSYWMPVQTIARQRKCWRGTGTEPVLRPIHCVENRGESERLCPPIISYSVRTGRRQESDLYISTGPGNRCMLKTWRMSLCFPLCFTRSYLSFFYFILVNSK